MAVRPRSVDVDNDIEGPIENAIAFLQECLRQGYTDLVYSETWGEKYILTAVRNKTKKKG